MVNVVLWCGHVAAKEVAAFVFINDVTAEQKQQGEFWSVYG